MSGLIRYLSLLAGVALLAISVVLLIRIIWRDLPRPAERTWQQEAEDRVVPHLHYFRDPRTGACFVLLQFDSVSYVPCEFMPKPKP